MRLAIILRASAIVALATSQAAGQDSPPAHPVTDPQIKAEVLQLIHNYYFRAVTIDTSLSADRIVASLDPHSSYVFAADTAERLSSLAAPTFRGFGLRTIRVGGTCLVDYVDPRGSRRCMVW